MFARLGRLVVHHPWRVIGIWLIAAVAIIGLAPKLTATTDESSFLPTHYESIQAQNLQESAFPHAASPAAIIVFADEFVLQQFLHGLVGVAADVAHNDTMLFRHMVKVLHHFLAALFSQRGDWHTNQFAVV